MIHQPAGGMQGKAEDMKIYADRILKTRQSLNEILADLTGQTIETIAIDTDRDNFMSAEEAKEYGIIDKIFDKR
jgi:ATP-dependent Clp protease protease subunit